MTSSDEPGSAEREETPMTERAPKAHLDASIYGVRAQVEFRPDTGAGGEHPESWKDVRARLKKHFMKIAVDLAGAGSDALNTFRTGIQSLGNAFKGTSQVPSAVASRIRDGRREADKLEDSQQEPFEADESPQLPAPINFGEPSKALLDRLEALRACGIHAELVPAGGSDWMLIVVRPDLADRSKALGIQALLEAAEPSQIEEGTSRSSPLLLEAVASPNPVTVGDTTTYTISVTNQGSRQDTDIQIVCEMEDQAEFASAVGADGEPGVHHGGVITFNPIDSLAPGHSRTWTVVVRAVGVANTRFRTVMTSHEWTQTVEVTAPTAFVAG